MHFHYFPLYYILLTKQLMYELNEKIDSSIYNVNSHYLQSEHNVLKI